MGDGVPWLRRAILRASWQWARSRDDNDVGYLFGHGGSARAWLSLSISKDGGALRSQRRPEEWNSKREKEKRDWGGSTDSTPLEYHENSGVAKRDDALIFYVSRGAPQCIIMSIEGLPSCRMQIHVWKELTHVWVVASSIRYRA